MAKRNSSVISHPQPQSKLRQRSANHYKGDNVTYPDPWGSGYDPKTGIRIAYRDSRCPGCHGRVSLKYQITKVDGSYRWKLLSSSIGHPKCVEALEDLRKEDFLAFAKEIHG